MAVGPRPFALVTGASTGIGFELAHIAAEKGHDLLIAADRGIDVAAAKLRQLGTNVDAVETDLSVLNGVDRLHEATRGRPVDMLFANAGVGLGHAFVDQSFDAIRHVIDTNITGTVYLIHKVARGMAAQGAGRILITGSIAGFVPGSFQAVYNGTKAFMDSFAIAIRNELKDKNVVVTVLMPGPTETEFFHRAGMDDTKVASGPKDSAREVAQVGYAALMDGDADAIPGWRNKLQVALSKFASADKLAEMHAEQAAPGTSKQ